MALHRFSSITLGVPNVDEVISYYEEWGLTNNGDGSFNTRDGGRQLIIASAPRRCLAAAEFGADDRDDLGRIAANLAKLDIESSIVGDTLSTVEPVTGVPITVVVQARVTQPTVPAPVYNGPGRVDRVNNRAAGAINEDRIRPFKLGHIAFVSPDAGAAVRNFTEGFGFKISDTVGPGAFMRCSPDHHNFAVLPGPISFMHHSSWQVEDVDQIGKGAQDMLEGHPDRHVWGLGRHYAGSNFFYYLRDPSGGFSEYYSDMDVIENDDLWTPAAMEGARGLYSWGPPPSPSFLAPEDLADLMTASHSG